MLDDMIAIANLYIPYITDIAVRYHLGSDPGELIIDTDDNRIISFDTYTHTTRTIPNDVQLNNEKEYRSEFGRRLRRMMRVRGVSQAELARRIGVRQSLVSRYVLGEVTPSIFKAWQIATALDCDIGALLCRR